VDEAHETLSGPATKKILEREFQQYQHAAYERLARISVAHIYNLLRRPRYRERRRPDMSPRSGFAPSSLRPARS